MGARPRYAADGKTAMPAAKYKAKEWTPQDMALLLDLVKADLELTGSEARSRHPHKINACITNLWDDENYDPLTAEAPRDLSKAKRRRRATDQTDSDKEEDWTLLQACTGENARPLDREPTREEAAREKACFDYLTKGRPPKTPITPAAKLPLKSAVTNPPSYSSVAMSAKKPALPENLSENFQMGPNLRPPDRKLGAGSNIVLHDLVWYQEDGKYYYMVYIYNMEGMKLTFQISPDARSLECRYTPRLKAPNYYADPNHDRDSPRNVSVYQYFGNAGAEQFTCFIHFPYLVERDPIEKERHLSEKVAITGVSPDSSLVTVKAARPGGIVLIYRLAGQTSQVTTQIEYDNFGVLLDE
ncbi:hypothetical protein BDR26DRAFT_1017627 [Obelidium mucronatum]|nr:hypothetical protein BDR26DRAFT_1017627 [Obelidium mucronatum]